MTFNKWTLGLAAVGAVSLASVARADETKMSQIGTAISNTTISGYVDVAVQWNPGNATQSNGKVDNFSVNDVDIALDKPLDESPWASGYHFDLNAGSDAITPLNSASTSLTIKNNTTGKTTTYSTPYSATFGRNTYSINNHISAVGLRQGYVALRTPVGNGIDWKVGLFDGITGYEGNTGYSNPNYTRSYGYAVNPASEAGALASYKVCNEVAVQLGMGNRMSGTSVGLSSHDYIAALALTAPDSFGFLKGSVLNLQTIQTFDNGGVNNYSVNGTFNTPVAGLKFGLAYDKVQSLAAEGADGNVYGVYATYQATEKLGFNLRGEYIDGQNLGFFGAYNSTTGEWTTGNGKGEEITATVEYDLWANVVSRVEFRWDHTESGTQYNANATENAFLVALNLVYKF